MKKAVNQVDKSVMRLAADTFCNLIAPEASMVNDGEASFTYEDGSKDSIETYSPRHIVSLSLILTCKLSLVRSMGGGDVCDGVVYSWPYAWIACWLLNALGGLLSLYVMLSL